MKKVVATITGRTFKVSSNKKERVYTLKEDDGLVYRTYPMNKQEFESACYWTGNDWVQFLKTDEYYIVK